MANWCALSTPIFFFYSEIVDLFLQYVLGKLLRAPCFPFVFPQNKLKTIYVQAKEVPQIFVVAYLVPKVIENLSEVRMSSISRTSQRTRFNFLDSFTIVG